jgi:hypothetical protein
MTRMLLISSRKWLGVLGLAAALVLCAAGGPSFPQPSDLAARSPGPQPDAGAKLDPALVGVLFGVLTHEMGHMVIAELTLPAVGPEEDAADEFAAMVYVYNIHHNQQRFRDLSLSAARLWREMGLKTADSMAKVLQTGWFDEHSIDAVRYGRMLCILYGGAPQAFEEEVTKTVPDYQQAHFRAVCQRDFTKKWAAWNTLLRKHRRNLGDPELPADLPADAPGKKMRVDYRWVDVPLAATLTKSVGAQLRDSKIFDRIAESFTKEYALPEADVTIFVRECDVQFNAWYSPHFHSISMCLNIAKQVAEYLKTAPRPGG